MQIKLKFCEIFQIFATYVWHNYFKDAFANLYYGNKNLKFVNNPLMVKIKVWNRIRIALRLRLHQNDAAPYGCGSAIMILCTVY
jgi:hypothetical protein